MQIKWKIILETEKKFGGDPKTLELSLLTPSTSRPPTTHWLKEQGTSSLETFPSDPSPSTRFSPLLQTSVSIPVSLEHSSHQNHEHDLLTNRVKVGTGLDTRHTFPLCNHHNYPRWQVFLALLTCPKSVSMLGTQLLAYSLERARALSTVSMYAKAVISSVLK